MNLPQLKQACLDKIEAAYQAAEAEFKVIIPRVPVTFSAKQTRTAGTASYTKTRFSREVTPTGIKLSLPLLKLNGDDFINQTPGHEAAHIIDFVVFNNTGHGTTWKKVMRVIGQEAKRCHNFATPTAIDSVEASCGCATTHTITKHRASKMRLGATYRCKKCRQLLTLGTTKVFNPEPVITAKVTGTHIKMTVNKKGSKAEAVRNIIRENDTASIDELIALVNASDIGIPRTNVRKYVTENVTRVRG